MDIISGIFKFYSDYSGSGVLTVLFFVALIFVALSETNRSNRTILLYGSISLLVIIFCPLTYYVYMRYVDVNTYWRFFWLIPVGIGLAYVGTRIASTHPQTGLIMMAVVFILGGSFCYTSLPQFRKADNLYQIPEEVIAVADYIREGNSNGEDAKVAVGPEMLPYIRQYDTSIVMPYGREQLDEKGCIPSGFYQLMASAAINYAAIGEKCLYNNTRYIVVNNQKSALNDPGRCGFKRVFTAGTFDVYEYTELNNN